MRLLILSVVFLMLHFADQASAQISGFKCPWDEVDCPGKCGRFYDANGDGFCDYGLLSAVVKPDTVAKKDTSKVVTNTVNSNKTGSNKTPENKIDTAAPDTVQADATATPVVVPETKKTQSMRSYSLLFITLLCFGLYGLTSWLHEMKIFRKFVHRRIWNVLLLLTFLTTAVLGIILVFMINYSLDATYLRDYLYWHVQFGIAMTIISIIHIAWHWKYFFRLFSKKSKSDCIN
ncbi:hypothetical protein SDC9_54713 [bioreactor metagenome]|uniref:DUF4405 domain-containing protein n=1 Tax=bioreactor metagenome TaxID=1076179 RepID=A0A644WXQ9_9ZZZZ